MSPGDFHRAFAAAMVLLLAPPAAIAAEQSASLCSDATYAKLRPPHYPPDAAARHIEGTVLVDARLDAHGTPESVALHTSSGSAELDQAGLDAVSTWRFNPAVCHGKPVSSVATVPVSFTLYADSEAHVPDALASRPPDAGEPVFSTPGLEIAPDHRPMESRSGAEALTLLEGNADIRRERGPLSIEPGLRWTLFASASTRWEVVDGRPAGISVVRWRSVRAGVNTWQVYGQACDGAVDWCGAVLAMSVSALKENPPPPAPDTAR